MGIFKDKVVLVTGAASGIGLGIAKRFIKEGALVVGTDLNADTLGIVSNELGSQFLPIVSDAGNVEAIKSVVETIKTEYGRLDYLINNAGIGVLRTPEEVSEEEYDMCMNVLLKGPVFFLKYAAEMLRAAEDGCVVNISSASATITLPAYTPYALAKAAINKFTNDSVVQAPGIRHNSILPGIIDTPILDSAYGEEKDGLLQAVTALAPSKRIGSPDDIANVVAFLCSPESTFVNGVNLAVDGGISHVSALSAEKVLAS